MWDIIGYVEKEVSLLIRREKLYYLLRFPWTDPAPVPLMLAEPKAEAIKVPQVELLEQLRTRALVHAIHHACSMSRGGLGGKTAGSIEVLARESLKFALRRNKNGQVSPSEFIQMLMSCAILVEIPASFWSACESSMAKPAIVKLKESLACLDVLRPKGESWLKPVLIYLQRVKWMQNDFPFIQTVCRELAICYRDHECGQAFNELRLQASGLIQREQIEKDLATQRPWQRNALPNKKAIRIGPASTQKKMPQKADDGDKT